MDAALYSIYTVVFIIMSIWAVRLALKTKNSGIWALAVVSIAMVYEDGMLVIGSLIGHGPLLETLSWLRFIGLGAVPPLLVITGLEMNRRAGSVWANHRLARPIAWFAVIAVGAFGIFQLRSITLVPATLNDIVRYIASPKLPPPIPVILMSMAMIVLGFSLWRRTGLWLLMVGSIFLFGGDALAKGAYTLSAGVEMIFMVLLAVAEMQFARYLVGTPKAEAVSMPVTSTN